mgnify:CR=1 FL=1
MSNKLKTIDEAWLGLDDVENTLFNPMSIAKPTEIGRAHV